MPDDTPTRQQKILDIYQVYFDSLIGDSSERMIAAALLTHTDLVGVQGLMLDNIWREATKRGHPA